jgi:hypothetical protein
MRKLPFSPIAFMIAFCGAYAVVFAKNWPLFIYYPLHGKFSWGLHVMQGIGPGMAWYGFMANAGAAALLVAIVVPNRMFDSLFRNYLWLFPIGAMLEAVFLLRQWFI